MLDGIPDIVLSRTSYDYESFKRILRDSSVLNRIPAFGPGPRGDSEFTDLNSSYLRDEKIQVNRIERGTEWLPRQIRGAVCRRSNKRMPS